MVKSPLTALLFIGIRVGKPIVVPKNVAAGELALAQETAKVTWRPGAALAGVTAPVALPGGLAVAAAAGPADSVPAAASPRAAELTKPSATADRDIIPREMANRLIRRMNVPPQKTALHQCKRPPSERGRARLTIPP
jgi:hypothetical protein